MMESLKMLIVEDDSIIAADIAAQMTSNGYEVLGVMSTGEAAIEYVNDMCCPDLMLMDVRLKGTVDGIDTAYQLNLKHNIPIIYLTANVDEATYNRAKMTNPYAFVAKPFSQLELSRTVELVSNKIVEQKHKKRLSAAFDVNAEHNDSYYVLDDSIFIKEKEKLVKIKLDDIIYLEADRNYSRFFTTSQTYVFSMPLKALERRINACQFIRTHRSFVVNLKHLEEVLEDFVLLAGKQVPLSRAFRLGVLKSIKRI